MIIALAPVIFLPGLAFSQDEVKICDFRTVPWFKSVKLVWKVTAPDGSDGILEVYRSDKEEGPYVLLREIQLGDKKFIDVTSETYFFYDMKLKIGRKYYYKLSLRGVDQVFGPVRGVPSGIRPIT